MLRLYPSVGILILDWRTLFPYGVENFEEFLAGKTLAHYHALM
jgi:hypothetical protein